MFKNLRTSTKLFVLCTMFILAIAVTTYELVAEKQIAIDFARRELAGTRYLTTLRAVYAAILRGGSGENGGIYPDKMLKSLAAAQAEAGNMLQTAEIEEALSATLRKLWSGTDADDINALIPEALGKAQKLAFRIADDSYLSLDPDLDSYYVQNIIVNRMPLFLGQLGEVQTFVGEPASATTPESRPEAHFLILDGLLRSTMRGIDADLTAAYRGNSGGALKQTLNGPFAAVISNTSSYLGSVNANLGRVNVGLSGGAAERADTLSLDRSYEKAVDSAIDAWRVAQAQLDQLLQLRIDGLIGRLVRSLTLTGVLAGLSILLVLMTHRHIVRPLQRLELVARTVRETRDFNLRTDYRSEDEIGRLAVAFNDMMSELAKAREREAADQMRNAALQSDLARAARLTIVGEMAATIAHEINQPLTAIVTNGNAGLRWLANPAPDLGEARSALKRIVNDGHRASQVIGTIRAMLKKGGEDKVPLEVNDVIREVLALVHDDLQKRQVLVDAELAGGLPQLSANRVQLQQVILNLIMNAADAMGSVTDRKRTLKVSSGRHDSTGVLVTVEDSGTGIDPEHIDRIFDPFFTTKSEGMGLGLSICRSIIEGHGGHLSVSGGNPHGSVFHLRLPAERAYNG